MVSISRPTARKQHTQNVYIFFLFLHFLILHLTCLTAVIYITNIELWQCKVFLNQQTEHRKSWFCSRARAELEVALIPAGTWKLSSTAGGSAPHATPADILTQHVQLKSGLLFSSIWCGFLRFQTKHHRPPRPHQNHG